MNASKNADSMGSVEEARAIRATRNYRTDNNLTASPKGNCSKSSPPGVTTHKTGREGGSAGKVPYPSVR